ncbi:MAG TPA: SigE family RNA polymerase sigma factor [Nocardioides sp.]|nr:SigE family RNA polymerase sigma factor [Nocardioides sp.]
MASEVEFDEFVVARSPALLRTAYLLTRDVQLAEDLLQTALTKAWFSWTRIDGDPEPYVRRILINTSVSWWRRRWTHETPTGFVPEPAPGVGSAADVHDLVQALVRLPRRQRAVVVLRYIEDRTEADTASLMGCSVGTIKSQCAKALKNLRKDAALRVAADERSAL